jgi:hypothetical protein
VAAFLADGGPSAFARVVERLLASPQYGERWGRHWLDVARYSDTGGFEADLLYQGAWRYRDYVIRSLNADKPFDRFLQEQVAGDELWPEDGDAVLDTGLYGVGPALAESAMVSDQLEYEWLTDATDTTGAGFLGLTFGCARYHDHNPYGFNCWLAGGGVREGNVIGATDEFGLHAVKDRVHVNDLHATILKLLGLDHRKLTFLFEGRDQRLTDVGGDREFADRLLR